DGQIITIYDPLTHKQVDDPATRDGDERWMLCRRPRVVVGGELTIEMLELQFNPVTKYYAAPAQLKANNGLLIVDDFGRQRVRPEERSEEHTSELQSRGHLVCRLLLEKKKHSYGEVLLSSHALNLEMR